MYKEILKKLFYLDRSLLGENNNKALELISETVPLEIHTFKSGQKVLDWSVPKEWRLKKAILKTENGEVICDASENILRVVNCSHSVNKRLPYYELKDHLHFSSKIDNAIPYRTSYYSKKWGFCLTKEEYDNLDKDINYLVEIESDFLDSEVRVGEIKIPGTSEKEIIFTSYLCHPRQAHDGLSGVIALLQLYDILKNKKNTYTYRLFFMPETIGPICLLDKKIIDNKNVEYCFVSTCVGSGKDLFYKKTFLGNHPIDNIICSNKQVKQIKFFPNGSDERQFSSPKIRIPTGSIMSKMYGDYDEYHTSQDDLSFIEFDVISKIVNFYISILEQYEQRERLIINHAGGEPFLSKKGLYRDIGATRDLKSDKIRNWILFYCDGCHSIIDISEKINEPVEVLRPIVDLLIEKNIISKVK